uniref:Solute carrier family 66 member 1 like n=1 Tax=Propithecus coquereli TaxID=379532 RepID=A0A2K6EFI4_PROCO
QLYIAHETGKVAEVVSLGFLLCWIGGDLTNIIGYYLTNELLIQSKENLLKRLHFCYLCWP